MYLIKAFIDNQVVSYIGIADDPTLFLSSFFAFRSFNNETTRQNFIDEYNNNMFIDKNVLIENNVIKFTNKYVTDEYTTIVNIYYNLNSNWLEFYNYTKIFTSNNTINFHYIIEKTQSSSLFSPLSFSTIILLPLIAIFRKKRKNQ